MEIYRLVLTSGLIITQGDPWPDAKGKPLSFRVGEKDVIVPGHVWQIVFVPDRVESFQEEDEEGPVAVAETTPAHYKVLMRANGGGGIPQGDGTEKTQCYTIPATQVVFVGESWDWSEALEEFKILLGLSNRANELPNANKPDNGAQLSAGNPT